MSNADMTREKVCATLFWSFFKIGAFTFGGGYAMLPLIQRDMIERHGWINEEDMLDIIAIAECTPGPIAINSATFVGYRCAGFWGALCATLGVVLPSFVVILLISGILSAVSHLKVVQYAFMCIRAGVLAMILQALVSLYKKSAKGAMPYAIMALAMGTSLMGVSTPYILIAAALVGIACTMLAKRGNNR